MMQKVPIGATGDRGLRRIDAMYGWTGTILRVDLSTGEISEVSTAHYVPRLIGGWGIMAKIAWDELSPEIGAFDPNNRIMFMTGPLTGTLVPGTGRGEIATISPITYSFKGPTEDYVRSGIGGKWAPELKFAGYDGIIVQGTAPKPVWLSITDGKVELRDAQKLWGLNTYATQEAIWDELGSKKVKVVCIGPAGERLVRFATIATDNGNHSGVGGTGAVMGSKKLKAIAIRGTGGVAVAKPEELYELTFRMHKAKYRADARPPDGLFVKHRMGHGGPMDRELREHEKKDTIKSIACWGCPIGCRMVFSVPDGIVPGISNFCSVLSTARRPTRTYQGRYTKNYLKVVGLMDGNGVGSHDINFTINWLRGCYEAGLLSEKDTGISLEDYGSYEFFERLITTIVSREGFGDLLAEGVHRASDALGKIGKQFINDINRGFKESYQPRNFPTSALLAAVESSARLSLYHTWANRIVMKHGEESDGRGWLSNDEWVSRIKELLGTDTVIDHSNEGYYRPDKAFLAKWTEDYKTATAGGLILCDSAMAHFWSWYSDEPNRRDPSLEHESQAFSLVTGVNMDPAGMLKAGERVRNVERAIMVREGRRREDDTLAEYCFTTPQKKGITDSKITGRVPGPDGHWIEVERAIDREQWERLKDAYYQERGWDPLTGIPTRAKFEELDLKDIAEGLQGLGIELK